MDVKYEFPGSIEIQLDATDLAAIRTQGYCMDRDGLMSVEGKTWIRLERLRHVPRATIDGDGDLNVWIPADTQCEITVPQENIEPGNNVRGEDIVKHYLGIDGLIRVIWSMKDTD